MKKLLSLLLLGLISVQVNGADLIFKHGFENTALVGGVVTGLTSTGLVLQLTVGANNENLSMDSNGMFIFNQDVLISSVWTVTVQTQPNNPTLQTCSLSNATGTMTASGVNNVQLNCSATPNNWGIMKWDEGTWQ